jgi:putative nucleotidyltransferase with HDIG domain
VASAQENGTGEPRQTEAPERLGDIIERWELPALPAVAKTVLGMMDRPDLNLRTLSGVLSDDPVISARILAISRSACHGQRILPTTLQAALQVIGLRNLRNVIVSIVTHGVFSFRGPVAAALWSHSLAVALSGRILSARLKKIDPEQAFLAGLLHDAGQMIFLKRDQDAYTQIASGAKDSAQLMEAEQEHYHCGHGVVGAALIDSWKLDTAIGEALRAHHNQPKIDPESLGAVLTISDYLAFRVGLGFMAPAPAPSPEMLRSFALENEEAVAQIAAQLLQAFNAESVLLKAA